MTPLDEAHAAMMAAPDDDRARLRFFERLGDSELFLLLEAEATDDTVTPQTFETGGETLVLIFDREDRLAEFVGSGAPFAALSGRVLSRLLADQDLGFALNPDVAPSSFVLAAEGVAWLADTLAHEAVETDAHLTEFQAPSGLPETVLTALDQKLATAIGLAQAAYLVATRSDQNATGHLLGIVAPLPGAEPALVQAVNEALTFSGLEAGVLDVAFFAAESDVAGRLARVGLRFDLPQPDLGAAPMAPGSDPEKPPILK